MKNKHTKKTNTVTKYNFFQQSRVSVFLKSHEKLKLKVVYIYWSRIYCLSMVKMYDVHN